MEKWQGQQDLNPQPTVLETATLPIELYPYNMGWLVGIEPTHAGATIQCVNHFTTTTIETSSFLSSQAVSSQVLSAFECLTTVFGMGTGGTTQLSPLDILLKDMVFQNYTEEKCQTFYLLCKLSPRHISTGPLQTLRLFHSQPINLVVFKVSYQTTL